MKNILNNKKHLLIGSLFIFALALYILPDLVYAATSAKVPFCDYAGVRRTFKICGMVINIAKLLVPILIIVMGMIDIFKTVTSGKSDDLTGGLMKLAKRIIAGLIIFFLPAVLDAAFDELIGYDDSGFTQCTNCLLDTDSCTIPETDPNPYTD